MVGMKMMTTSCRCGIPLCVLLKHCFSPYLDLLVSDAGCPHLIARMWGVKPLISFEHGVLAGQFRKSWQRLPTPAC